MTAKKNVRFLEGATDEGINQSSLNDNEFMCFGTITKADDFATFLP